MPSARYIAVRYLTKLSVKITKKGNLHCSTIPGSSHVNYNIIRYHIAPLAVSTVYCLLLSTDWTNTNRAMIERQTFEIWQKKWQKRPYESFAEDERCFPPWNKKWYFLEYGSISIFLKHARMFSTNPRWKYCVWTEMRILYIKVNKSVERNNEWPC